MFAQSATACGATETGLVYEQCGGILPLFPQRTIYESLLDAGHDFGVFYNGSIFEGGVPGDIYIAGMLKHIVGRAKTFTEKGGFFERAASGMLPQFSWVLPRNGGAHPNDDHPCHDMALGEELLKSVYEALRASPAWNDTALLVVYDDPGGFFDHVPTPLYAPPPNTACDRKNKGCPDTFVVASAHTYRGRSDRFRAAGLVHSLFGSSAIFSLFHGRGENAPASVPHFFT
jgi:hypothetical protein